MAPRRRVGPGRAGIPPLALVALTAAGACAPPPDPAVVEALTSGIWHSRIGEDDYLYALTYEDGSFGGRLHRVTEGKQIFEIPVSGVTLRGATIEIGNRGFPSYEGEADLERGRIVGGAPRAPRFRQMNLARVAADEWPMLQLRPAAASGEPVRAGPRPEKLEDGWLTASPPEVGIEAAAVEETVRAVVEGGAAALHSLLVVRDGRLAVEEYFHGWGRDDLHEILSCTKSVASLLVGLAIDRRELAGVDVGLLDFFPHYAPDAGRGWETVRLEQLLTMTMGLDWDEDEIGWQPTGIDRFADVLRRDIVEPPGTRFRYVGRNVNLLAGVLDEATGVEADVFAAEHLFAPLGITSWDWDERRWQGHPEMSAALELRPRDMAKLGQLVLDWGRWQGRQVVSSEWIRESTRAHVEETPYDVQYGYLWWRIVDRPDFPFGEVPFANGIGSQFILVVPEARMVVVTTGGNNFNGRQFDIQRLLARHLVPGIR